MDPITLLETTSYLFIEPDKRKCRTLARRMGVGRVYVDPNDMILTIRSLKPRLIGSAILNCTFEDVISSDLIARLLPKLMCI